MVHKNRARSSSLFLMELILAILFFSVASAVCVQFFVKSHLLNLDSKALTHAVNECSGAAEIITTADSLADGLSLLQKQYPDGKYPDPDESEAIAALLAPDDVLTEKDGAIRIYYDESFSACAETAAAYIMDIQLTYSGRMLEVVLEMYEKDALTGTGRTAPIYHLETKHHIARRTGTHER